MAHIIIALHTFFKNLKKRLKAIFESTRNLDELKNIHESFWEN